MKSREFIIKLLVNGNVGDDDDAKPEGINVSYNVISSLWLRQIW